MGEFASDMSEVRLGIRPTHLKPPAGPFSGREVYCHEE